MSELLNILKSAGPISLYDLRVRAPGTPKGLVGDLKRLTEQGLVTINGPLERRLEDVLHPDHTEDAAQTTVELSSFGFKSLMPST
jgi:hypothetical protein